MPFTSPAQQWRVVEKVSGERGYGNGQYMNSFVTVDSTIYHYTNTNRGSSRLADTINFDTAYTYILNTAKNLMLSGRTTNEYTMGGVLRMSKNDQRNQMTGGWTTTQVDSYAINNGLTTQIKRYGVDYWSGQRPFVNKSIVSYTYNANGQVTSKISFWNGSATQPPQERTRAYYFYDANGLLVKDSVSEGAGSTWKPIAVTLYGYDANGNNILVEQSHRDTLGTWNKFHTRDLYYNVAGQLIKDSSYYADTPLNYWVSAYAYNASGQKVADTFRYSSWAEYDMVTYSYTPYGYLNEELLYYYDTVKNVYEQFFKRRYKYEYYWPTTINSSQTAFAPFLLYPNPATHVLHINSEQMWEHGRIYNSTGQVVKELPYRKQVIISDLPAGNYFIQLVRGTYVRTGSFVVVR